MKLFKRGKKAVIAAVCGVIVAGCVGGAYLLWGNPEPESVTVSAGVRQLADAAYLACSAPVGQNVSFSSEWFDRALNGGTVTAVTVTELPPVTEGVLKLGYGEVALGDTVPRETLSYLSFEPREGVSESAFRFVPTTESGTAGYALRCRVLLTDTVNCCPTGTRAVMAVSTHESLAMTGMLTAEDPEGDELRFEICEYPENGAVTLNVETGDFNYIPRAGFCGTDRFTWRVQDVYGAFAEPAAVEVTVRALPDGYTFADIEDPAVHTAALRVGGTRLLDGETVGGKHYFHPHKELTRAAFVAVLLKAAEIEVPEAAETGFTDDAEIPAGMKGAVAYARERGWLGEEEKFRPNDPVTRAEAAKIAAAVLSLSAPGYAEAVRDFEAIPVDAADAIYALFEGGYISTMADGTIAPAAYLTRGDAAKFFARLLDGRT